MKKTAWLITATLILSISLAACGKADAEQSASPAAEAAAEASEAETAEVAPSVPHPEAPPAESAEESASAAEAEPAPLPAFSYGGEDPHLAAVCDYIVKEKGSQYAQGDVCIPAPVILQVDADDPGNVRVWGNFWVYNYTLDGTRLLTESGGEHPGILHLMQVGNDYQVTSMEEARDGAQYMEDIERFCEGYPGLAEQMANSHEAMETSRLQMIQYYVGTNDLDIDSYQDYGWPAKSVSDGSELPE